MAHNGSDTDGPAILGAVMGDATVAVGRMPVARGALGEMTVEVRRRVVWTESLCSGTAQLASDSSTVCAPES
jgi:hypothetical protein